MSPSGTTALFRAPWQAARHQSPRPNDTALSPLGVGSQSGTRFKYTDNFR